MPSRPLVSVVIPSFNRRSLVERAVASVLAQSVSDLECIVVDDGSKDDSFEFLSSHSDSRVKAFQHSTNRGASAARNTGISKSQGHYVAFLDDDDIWLESKLQKQLDLIETLPEDFGGVYCWMDYFNEKGEVIQRHHPKLRGDIFLKSIDRQAAGGCPTWLLKKQVVEKVKFDEKLRRGNDGDFIRRFLQHFKVDFVPEVLVHVFVDHGFERISTPTRKSLEYAIETHKDKIAKFGEILKDHPHIEASILSTIALHYAKIGNIKEATRYHCRALSKSLFSGPVYKNILQSQIYALKGKAPSE